MGMCLKLISTFTKDFVETKIRRSGSVVNQGGKDV